MPVSGAGHWPDCTVAREDGGPNTASPNTAGNNIGAEQRSCACHVTRSRDQHMCRVIQSVTPALYSKANTISWDYSYTIGGHVAEAGSYVLRLVFIAE